ncbi:MAG: OmpA family protein [Candidatus Eisenbacteria bacterium]|jgi:hypothetical protein|nr:OmpA family protein [Candidatus Eisenbacteria bacterium]
MTNRVRFPIVALLVAVAALPSVAASPEVVNLLSLQEGSLPVIIPPTYGGWEVEGLLDDSPSTGWACEAGRITDNVFLFELVAEAAVERFEFDQAYVDAEGAGARDVLVEVSASSSEEVFTTVLEATLVAGADGQVFPASRVVPARRVRLTIRNNHGNLEWTELFSFRGFGPRPASSALADISGTYETNYSDFHVRQQGTALIGCYDFDEGLLEGTIEGRLMKITWREHGGADDRGPAVIVFAPDGKSFKGFWWYGGNEAGKPGGVWDGRKASDAVGGCPHWSGSLEVELERKLESEGRARIYGILFDEDSAVIRPESAPVLDEVAHLLLSNMKLKLTIEGHTDDTGPGDHNQTLSEQRAEAVKARLVAYGIDRARLGAVGFGESRPVADNATELGRAQNRRVELVRD